MRTADGRYEAPRLAIKVIGLRDDVGHTRSARCWVPSGCEPLPGVTEGQWAADGVRAFEDDLHRFRRQGFQRNDDDAA